MGSCFVGYMFVGPIVITDTARLAGIEHLAKYKKMFLAHKEVCEKNDEWDLPPGFPEELAAKEDQYCMDGDEIFDLWTSVEPERMVEEIVAAWEKGNNTMSRDVGDKKVVVCGDHTWGGEPDFWEYRAFREADILGLLDVMGIA